MNEKELVAEPRNHKNNSHKMKLLSTNHGLNIYSSLLKDLTVLTGFIGLALAGHAQTLTWNPAENIGGPSDGSGTWQTANEWWNGSANVRGTWSGSAANGAMFGAGTPGNYSVTLSPAVFVTDVTFNTSGYELSGSPLTVIAASA